MTRRLPPPQWIRPGKFQFEQARRARQVMALRIVIILGAIIIGAASSVLVGGAR